MGEEKTYETADLAGMQMRFTRPTQGQIESLSRIGYTLRNMGEDSPNDFVTKQLNRMGILLDSLIHPDDADAVDLLYLTGKVSHGDLIRAIMGKLEADATESEDKAIAKAKKSNPARVRRD